MVYSDTLVGVWSGRGVGPLGRLAPGVIGGYRDEAPAEVDDLVGVLPALDVLTNPFFEEPLRGHESLVIRGNQGSGMWEWMAASESARLEAMRLLCIEESQHLRTLVVVLEGLPRETLEAMRQDSGRAFEPLRRFGRLRMAEFREGSTGAVLEFETNDVAALLAALRAHLPPSAVSTMRAGHRSPFVMSFTPCWPPDLRAFVHPV